MSYPNNDDDDDDDDDDNLCHDYLKMVTFYTSFCLFWLQ